MRVCSQKVISTPYTQSPKVRLPPQARAWGHHHLDFAEGLRRDLYTFEYIRTHVVSGKTLLGLDNDAPGLRSS